LSRRGSVTTCEANPGFIRRTEVLHEVAWTGGCAQALQDLRNAGSGLARAECRRSILANLVSKRINEDDAGERSAAFSMSV